MKTTQKAQTTSFLPLSRVMCHDVDIDDFNSLTEDELCDAEF